MVGKRLLALTGAAACAVAVSACGAGEHARYSDNLGPGYVEVGKLNYQVQISRELNPWDVHEDKWYLQGFTSTQLQLPVSEEWFGVSLQVFNWTKQARTPTSDFFISDTVGDRFTPLRNPSPNPYSYVAESIPGGGRMPAVNSNAYASWTQGELLIFKVPIAALVNRPFILHIVNAAKPSKESQIELDV